MANEFDHAGFAKAHEAATKHNVTFQPPKPEEEPKNDFEKAQRLATQYDASNTWKAEAAKPEQTAKAPEANKPGDKKPDLGVHDQAQWSEITANKRETPSQPQEEKPKTSPVVIALTASSLALTGTGNQVAEKSEDVRAMQKQLIALGYDVGSKTGEPDGYLGPKTREAVAEAMKKGGLDPATTTIAELTERARMHLAYAEIKAEDEQKFAQKTTTSAAPVADASGSQQRQPAQENREVAWDPALAEKFYNPETLRALDGKTTASFDAAATKSVGSQPTNSLVQDMSLLNIFKPGAPA